MTEQRALWASTEVPGGMATELRARYGGAAYARVADQFDVCTVWPRLGALYREVSG